MRRSSWLLGLGAAFLMACGVASDPASSQQELSIDQVQAAGEAPGVSSAAGVADSVTPHEACSPPGSVRDCCPFPDGCSCTGDQTCKANGMWGGCFGAGEHGHPCP
jgi:hypothetical protein